MDCTETMELTDSNYMYRQIAQKLIEASRLSSIPVEVYVECIGVLLTEQKNGKTLKECQIIANEFWMQRMAVATCNDNRHDATDFPATEV